MKNFFYKHFIRMYLLIALTTVLMCSCDSKTELSIMSNKIDSLEIVILTISNNQMDENKDIYTMIGNNAKNIQGLNNTMILHLKYQHDIIVK